MNVAELLSEQELCDLFYFLPVEVVLHIKQFLVFKYSLVKVEKVWRCDFYCTGGYYIKQGYRQTVLCTKPASNLQTAYLDMLLLKDILHCRLVMKNERGQQLTQLGLQKDWYKLYPPKVPLHEAALAFASRVHCKDYRCDLKTCARRIALYHGRRCRNSCWGCRQFQLNLATDIWWVHDSGYLLGCLFGIYQDRKDLAQQISSCNPNTVEWQLYRHRKKGEFALQPFAENDSVRQLKRQQQVKTVWMPTSLIKAAAD